MPTLLDLWGVPSRAPPAAAPSAATAWPSAPPVISSHYELDGTLVQLDGTSLVEFILPVAGGGTKRPRPYARSELREWMQEHRPTDDPTLPGARPMRLVGKGAQLYLRTHDLAYVGYFRTRCHCQPGLLLVDESLFDHRTDPDEARNLAYLPQHAHMRQGMLDAMLREWRVRLVGSTEPDRARRRILVSELARCFNASAPRCPAEFGDLR